jgi:hypothetical protein
MIPRLKSSTYLSMRVGDPVKKRGGVILGLVLISTENPNLEIASDQPELPMRGGFVL